jgi:transcriptional activator TraM
MTPAAEKFRQQIQKELGVTVGPKDPLLALWVAQQEFLEATAAEHQKLLSEFEVALGRSQTMWTDQAKGLANQSLNAALRAARDNTAALVEEAARANSGAIRAAVQEGVERLERALVISRRIAWVSLAASIVAFAASGGLLLGWLFH